MRKIYLLLLLVSTILTSCSGNDDNESNFEFGGSFTVNIDGESHTRNNFPSSFEADKCNDSQRLNIVDTAEIETSVYFFDIQLSTPLLASEFNNQSFSSAVISTDLYDNCVANTWSLNPNYSENNRSLSLDNSFTNSCKINSVKKFRENSTSIIYIVSGEFDVKYTDGQNYNVPISGVFDIEVQSLK